MQVHRTFPIVALIGLLASPAWSQEKVIKRFPTLAVPEQKAQPLLIDTLNFKGGSLLEYAELVKKCAQSSRPDGVCNLVINNLDWATEVGMPPVSLTKVSVETAFKLVEYLAERDEYLARISPLEDRTSASSSVYIVTVERTRRKVAPAVQTGQPSSERRLEAFVLSQAAGLTAKHPQVVSVLTAVDEALGIQTPPGEEKPKVRFHPDSGLLMVYGTEEETRIVGEILDRIGSGAKHKARLQQLQLEREDLSKKLEQMIIECETLRAQRAEMEMKHTALQEMRALQHDREQNLQDELQKAILERQQFVADRELAKQLAEQLASTRKQNNDLKAQVAALQTAHAALEKMVEDLKKELKK